MGSDTESQTEALQSSAKSGIRRSGGDRVARQRAQGELFREMSHNVGSGENDSQPQALSNAELRQQSERARIDAEMRKPELEAAEIEKRLKEKWYTGRLLVQTFVGAIVAAALLAAWFIGYLQPILQKKQDLRKLEVQALSLKNEVQEHLNALQQQDNERRAKALAAENEFLKNNLHRAAAENNDLLSSLRQAESLAMERQSLLEKLAGEFATLALKRPLTEKERSDLTEIARTAGEAANTLQQEIQIVRVARDEAELRSERITKQLSTLRELRTVLVTVLDPSRIPLGGIYLDRVPAGSREAEPLEGRTDSNGRKYIQARVGDQICTHEALGFRSRCQTVESDTTEMTLVLEKG